MGSDGDGRLAGRVALITGAARGQGAAEARLFAREGARVVLCDLLAAEGAAVARELGAERAEFVPLDVTDEAGWERAVARAVVRFGRLDVLVNNAAVHWRATLEQETSDGFERMLSVNVRGAFLGIRSATPALRAAGHGAIVNVSSTAGMTGYPELGAYAASKWALRGLTRVAALELAADGIRVNALLPGGVRTAMVADPDAPGRWDGLPAGRVGEVEEIAEAALFLASPASSYMTGADLVVDGGALAG
ncbi:MAG TPA: glucose 1-dehydrogenase [Conexibacter sp.]|nr:glucose 1-dehydrogenase [Conexibacter sp.]